MKLRDVIELIRFNTATANDLSGKAVNNIISNRAIIFQLQSALDRYASRTKGLEGIYSVPLSTNQDYVTAPVLALRSMAYKFAYVWINGQSYPLDIPSLSTQKTDFSYQEITGIPRWIVPWEKQLLIQPVPSISHNSTTLTSEVKITDTQINVYSGSNFLDKSGRITINDEKIVYQYRTENTLYNCTRGAEDTTPAHHYANDDVLENNLHIYYYKLHNRLETSDRDWVSDELANSELEVCAEHTDTVIDYATYRLLSKLDPKRADRYKLDFDEWLEKAKLEIQKGRSAIKKTGNVRNAYWWESGSHYPHV